MKKITLILILLINSFLLVGCYSFPMHDDQGNKIESAQEGYKYIEEHK